VIARGEIIMYVNNVRKSINELDDVELKEYLKRLRMVLGKEYDKSVKPSELKQRVEEFVEGKDPKIDYFEAYLLTFDELTVNGANNALNSKQIKMPKTWRQLLLSVTEDRTFSGDITKHLEDEQVLIEIKALFFNCIEHCTDGNKDQFFKNLYSFNNFLKIK
jgi:hypothetical protein